MSTVQKVHFVGVGGVGMGSLAQALSNAGFEVSGSDQALYEPMKSVLQKARVSFVEGYKAEHVLSLKPDVVVIGNVVRKENPESPSLVAVGGSRFVSFPQAVREFLIGERHSIVCAGTHGKTTTSTWISFLIAGLGYEPSYLIGGVPKDLPTGSQLGQGEVFVGEGDEYDSAFFDKGPKFLHYKPNSLILSAIEFDHADIYADLNAIKRAFQKLIALVPGDGLCVARYEDPNVMELVQQALCPVQTFGLAAPAMWHLANIQESESGVRFEVNYKGKSQGYFESKLFGKYNLLNLLSGIVCAANLGASMDRIRPLVSQFQGPRRRQEFLLEKPITLIDDFAHHPTAVKSILEAVKHRYSKRRVWALFEPRSATARTNVHQKEYIESLKLADCVLLKAPIRQDELSPDQRMSVSGMVKALASENRTSHSFAKTDDLIDYFLDNFKPGDVAVVMSNGGFDKIQEKLVSALSD